MEKRYEDKINNLQTNLKRFYTEELKVRTVQFATILYSTSCVLDTPDTLKFKIPTD